MCRLLETIQIRDGQMVNALWHNRRFNASRKELYGVESPADLTSLIEIPETCRHGIFRCRIVYGETIQSVEFLPYKYRKIDSLKLIESAPVDYHLKYAGRGPLESLFLQRGDCDDIIIVQHGCLTDSFAANLVFWNGIEWHTPDTPLLPGTQRARLLNIGKISERRITVENLRDYQQAGLINAFCDLETMPVIVMENILH